MENTNPISQLRKRRLMVVLPILVIPFITIIFWALGGGKTEDTGTKPAEKGFNATLPNANLKEGSSLDKMNYYDQAAIDSVKRADLIKKDPNYLVRSSDPDSLSVSSDSISASKNGLTTEANGMKTLGIENQAEAKVYRKLEALQKAIRKPIPTTPVAKEDVRPGVQYQNDVGASGNIDMLEQMMQSMGQQQQGQDPELQQLSGMLESILDIQYPERAQEKLRKASEAERGQVFAISTGVREDNVSLFRGNELSSDSRSNGFYSLEESGMSTVAQNAVEATVHETQTIVNGSTVKLRLANDIFINGIKIPKDNFLFGTAALKGERLTIKVNSLRYQNSIFPVSLSVFDMDGLDGIYIPGAINRDVAKASADRSMQTVGVATLDDSWGAQAAGVGIEAAKTLFSKKVKLVKVVVKAGYRILLRDEKQKQKDSH